MITVTIALNCSHFNTQIELVNNQRWLNIKQIQILTLFKKNTRPFTFNEPTISANLSQLVVQFRNSSKLRYGIAIVIARIEGGAALTDSPTCESVLLSEELLRTAESFNKNNNYM